MSLGVVILSSTVIAFNHIYTDLDCDLMDEKKCFYYVDIEELDDEFCRGLLKSLDKFVLESSEVSFRNFKLEAERAIRHSTRGHVTASKI